MFVNTFFENFTRNREQRNRSIISNYVFILFFVDRGDVCQLCLDRIVLRQHEVQDVLRLLNTNKASGPVAIHAKLLKVAYDIISKPVCAIFNISLITKHFPSAFSASS
jgi:hypothetical protein